MRQDYTWPILPVLAGCRPERTETAIGSASSAALALLILLCRKRGEHSWRQWQALSADGGLPKGLPSRSPYRDPQDGASCVAQRREGL